MQELAFRRYFAAEKRCSVLKKCKTNKIEMQMKQIIPLLAVALLLTGCQVRSVSNENDDDIIEAWLRVDELTEIPMLPARIDNTLKNICPDYLPGSDSVPSITGEVKMR